MNWKNYSQDDIKKALETLHQIIFKISEKDFIKQNLEDIFLEALAGKDRGYLLWPLRVALTGKQASPGPFEVAEILGKERTLQRIAEAQKMLD